MTLSPGMRLGPYEIVRSLGAGGMGEVYKATDTRLDRTVAVKVLPEHVAFDPELKQRFEREAKTLAALNHPHICDIYDVGSQGGIDYLVMEHLEGETLAQRLVKGALPLEQALQVAIQIADALDKAHRQGIVHRDLKPGNIMLTKGGAKLLDFGLAKLRPTSMGGGVGLSEAPTVSSPLTGEGTILGTFQYMAPEQLEGQEADERTDIFAFGAVLYEMLSGRKAFESGRHANIIASIMLGDPPPVSTIVAILPRNVDQLVAACLQKERDERWQTARDLARELRWIKEGLSATLASKQLPPRSRVSRIGVALAVIVVAVAATAGWAFMLRTPLPSPQSEIRTEIVTQATDEPESFAISPDGARIAFVASTDGISQLWVRSLRTGDSRQLDGTSGATHPFWSPDSSAIAFFADRQLKRINADGGAPQMLVAGAQGRGGTWNSEGVILFNRSIGGALYRIPATGGEAITATTFSTRQVSHRFPVFLSDNHHFIFYVIEPGASGIFLGSLNSDDVTRLTNDESPGVVVSPGWLLWVRQGTLIAQRLDVGERRLVGDPVTVAERVPGGALAPLSASASGLIAFRHGNDVRRQLKWLDRQGRELGVRGEPDDLQDPAVSEEGSQIAIARGNGESNDIWLSENEKGWVRLTFTNRARDPVWSGDGRHVAFDSGADRQLYVKRADGAESETLLFSSKELKVPHDWSTDSAVLLFRSRDVLAAASSDLWLLPIHGNRGGTPFPFLKTKFNDDGAQFSPDGQWIAYVSDETGRPEIHVRPSPGSSPHVADGSGPRWQVSTAGGVYPRWSADGRELYFLDPQARILAARLRVMPRGSIFQASSPDVLFQTQIHGGGDDTGQGWQYDVSADGRFLVNTVLDDAAAPITLIQNWNPAARE